MFRLICMAPDGDYVTEGSNFETVQAAWDRAEDMGSRWIFYPFSFVTTRSGLTVKDAPEALSLFKGMRVKKVAALFERVSKLPEAQKINDAYEYAAVVLDNA
jgi:hypothetical protein